MRPIRLIVSALVVALAWQAVPLAVPSAEAAHGWEGKRRISYQYQKDLFYNYYVAPGPYPGPGAQLYVSPQPVPPFVGHTYVTYQPFMPHEYLYRHERSYYTYNRGAGWTRTNVRYGTFGGRMHNFGLNMRWPMTNNIAAVNNDFYRPGVNCN
jgi:hypothetical protein